ncbi:MAG: fatty acid desaturase [Planctomycetota bacterium]
MSAAASSAFSVSDARSLIKGLGKPKPWVYWTDFLLSILVGHAAIGGVVHLLRDQGHPIAEVWHIVVPLYVVVIVLYMRAVMFIHELVHLPKKGFRGFRFVWNALCGIPLFIPSFLYYPHVDHHRRQHYGTEHDGEYLALSHHGRWMIVGFILQALLIPLLGFFRFAVLSPICWLIPGARTFVHRHASTMLVDPFYERTDHGDQLMRTVVLQEMLCFAWAMVFLFAWYLRTGEWFNPMWLIGYSVSVGLLVLNEIRTLGAHRWTNAEGEMSFEEQLLDSVNYPHAPWISELWGPVGTRYHALHHLFPSLPYHDLGKAHRKLVAGLPEDSPYHETIAPSLTSEILALWRRAAGSEPERVTTNANRSSLSSG